MQTDAGQERISSQREMLIPLGLSVGFLFLYIHTLCPTVYLGDAGEISTAIVTGGVPHPPGYPLFSLLGRTAIALLPSGEPAFRIGCVVALAAALAVGVLYRLARELGCSLWASATAAGMFGASYTFWSQSVRVEVYSLHVLLAGLLLLAGLRYRRTGCPSYLATSILVGSLAIAHHLTIVLLAPAMLALCGPRLGKDPGLGHRLALLGVLLPAGPALYLLLLVWARAEPLQAWGHPVTLPLLWNHASARVFHGLLQIPYGPRLSHGLAEAGALFTNNFPWLTCLLPLLGVGVLWKRDRGIAGGLVIAMGTVIVYNLCYQIDDIAPYYLAAWLVAAALLAVTLDAVRRHASGWWNGRPVATVVSALLVGVPLLQNYHTCDFSRATWVREFARQKLENAPPGSVLITQGDDDTFPIWYVHDALHVRPDITPIDLAMSCGIWSDYEKDPSLWYLYRLRREGVNVPTMVSRDPAVRDYLGSDGYLMHLLERELHGRPVCMTFATTTAPPNKDGRCFFRWATARYNMLPQGIIVRLQPKDQPVDLAALLRQNERLWDRIILPDLHGVRTDEDLDPNYVVNHYACMLVNLGGLYELAGEREHAAAIYRRAATWAPGYGPAAAALAALRPNASAQRRASLR